MTIMNDLKYKLLQTKQIINNQYLDKYIKLINSGTGSKDTLNTEQHHIIPFSYYAHQLNITIKKDKATLRRKCLKKTTKEYKLITENNVKYLTFYKHCLAHYYLYKCSILELKIDSERAFIKMTDRDLNLRNCSESEINTILVKLQNLRNDPDSSTYKSHLINTVIINNYSFGGYKECLRILNTDYAINITKEAVKARAQLLNITSNKFTPTWDSASLQVLYDNYEKYGYKKCLELLPGRTKFAIQARAKYLGLKAPGASKSNASWTVEEDKILQTYYMIGGTKLCKKYLPDRSEKAIKHRANNKLHIYLDSNKAVTNKCGKEKSVYLLDNTGAILKEFSSIKEAASYLKVSTASISAVCNKKRATINGYKLCFKARYGEK